MRHLFELALLGALLLALGNGAPQMSTNETSLVESEAGKNCTEVAWKTIFTCVYRMGGFMTRMVFADLKKTSSLEKLNKSCDSLAECMESLNCKEGTDSEATKRIKIVCESFSFFNTQFLPCLTKLETKPVHKCYDEWNQFPGYNGSGEEKKPEEVCTDLFGKDNCLKTLISERCGEGDWQLLLNRFKATPALKRCDFSGL